MALFPDLGHVWPVLAWAHLCESQPTGGGFTSTAAQLLPNSCGLVNSKFSGVLISLMVFKSKFPQSPTSWP